jgi:predicted transposase YbfD/YdcC
LTDEPFQKSWTRLNCLIVVEKQWYQKEKNTRKTDREMLCFNSVAYYISDLVLSAQVFAEGIRGHWGIENRLHWVKDVILKEDNNRIKHQNGAVNMAIFNNVAINFLRQNFDDSVKYSQILFGQNVKELFPKFRT